MRCERPSTDLGEGGASSLTLSVALIGVAVEVALSTAGEQGGAELIREIVDDRLAAHSESSETTH